jgi:hypothetical protein
MAFLFLGVVRPYMKVKLSLHFVVIYFKADSINMLLNRFSLT